MKQCELVVLVCIEGEGSGGTLFEHLLLCDASISMKEGAGGCISEREIMMHIISS